MTDQQRRQNKNSSQTVYKDQPNSIFFAPALLQEHNKILAGKLQAALEQNKLLSQKISNYTE